MLPDQRLRACRGCECFDGVSSVRHQLGTAAQRNGDVRMLGTKSFLLDGQSTGQQRRRFVVIACSHIQASEIHQGGRHFRMICPEGVLRVGQGALVERPGRFVVADPREHIGEIGRGGRHLWMVRAEKLSPARPALARTAVVFA